MSYLPPGQGGFFEAVQVYFMEITGRGALFSARDQALLKAWRDEGRSAQVVCRGIREALAVRGEAEDPPRSLSECEVFVDREWQRLREQQVGGHQTQPGKASSPRARREVQSEEAAGDGLYGQAAKMIETAGQNAEEERWREAYRRAWRELKRVHREREGFRFEEIEALDEALVEAYVQALKDQERRELEEELAADKSARQMSPTARREHLRARRKRSLIRRYGLLDLIGELMK